MVVVVVVVVVVAVVVVVVVTSIMSDQRSQSAIAKAITAAVAIRHASDHTRERWADEGPNRIWGNGNGSTTSINTAMSTFRCLIWRVGVLSARVSTKRGDRGGGAPRFEPKRQPSSHSLSRCLKYL